MGAPHRYWKFPRRRSRIQNPSTVGLISEETRSVTARWPSASFDRWVELKVPPTGAPDQLSELAFTKSLWGDHVYAAEVTREQLRKVTADRSEGGYPGPGDP